MTQVRVVKFGDRKHYQLQWNDPVTGKKKTKSSKATTKGAAERAAGELERKLEAGDIVTPGRVTWEQFRNRYESDVLPGKALATQGKVDGVFNLVEKILAPAKLVQLTAERLSHFQAELRRKDRSEASIKSTMAHLKAALRWAARVGLLSKAPPIEMPTRGSERMRGRPLVAEEFDRMIEAVPKVVPEADVARCKRLLRGLWLSGLRVSEALALSWEADSGFYVDMSGRRPFLVIAACMEKGNKNRMLPITPDFAAFLAETPEGQRRGKVFAIPRASTGRPYERSGVSHLVADIGQQAGIKVSTHQRTGKVKFASCHDLRRSFGERWAAKVMPQVLMELMRHETIATTMAFYVGKNAERTADAVWAAVEIGNTFGNTSAVDASPAQTPDDANAEVPTC